MDTKSYRVHLLALGTLLFGVGSACRPSSKSLLNAARDITSLEKAIEAELLKDGADSNRTFQELIPAYRNGLKKLLHNGWDKRCDKDCLAAVAEAANYVCFFSYDLGRDPELPAVRLKAFRRLKSLGVASREQAEEVRLCLLKHREYEAARAFSAEETLSDPVPRLTSAELPPPGRRVIRYEREGQEVRFDQLARKGTSEVIMVSKPSCRWSEAALKEIMSSPALRPAIVPTLTIVSVPSGRLDALGFLEWNRKYPNMPQFQAYSGEDWPEVGHWETTPTFFFVSKGRVIATKSGWGPDSLKEIEAIVQRWKTSDDRDASSPN